MWAPGPLAPLRASFARDTAERHVPRGLCEQLRREGSPHFIFSGMPFLTRPGPAEAKPVCVSVRDEVIASPSHYFQAGCRGSLSQVEPVRAAGTRGDKGGSLDCDWSSAARASPGAPRSAGVGSTPPGRRRGSAGAAGCCCRPREPGLGFPSASCRLH